MKIAVPKVIHDEDMRVTLIPEHAGRLVKAGLSVTVESGLGESARYPDDAYQEAGAEIITDRQKLIAEGDMVLGLCKPGSDDIKQMKAGAIYAGMLDPFNEKALVQSFSDQGVSTICMEMVPRSTRAQKMDVLSSQASLAGYVAVIVAAEQLDQILPMMMTPAGTLKPSRVFIIGAGVAGLQAIATAKRLGARVEAFDTRAVVKEEVQSLGAKFIEVDLGETGQTKDGYAKALTDEQLAKQREAMAKVCSHSDIVITTAQLFGRPAPRIITRDMIQNMMPGAVIVDMAVESGGNVEGSKPGEVVEINGVRIMGLTNLPGRVPVHASQMYSSNLTNLILEFWKAEEKKFNLDLEDEIIQGCLITHEKKIIHPMILEHYKK
ncbi:Re/Si-specific NAD(P)(+) transhydrogenase subunit alpha [candidate division KSB1 bacterium]|nr:Re/Si-specific NAD(P)(+) transhydrogenase subunit alpha [candidate division KSB1 bacterium]